MLCVGVAGPALSPGERKTLKRFGPGAIILFKRNYADRAQLRELCRDLHRLYDPPPFVAVDQEGGRVIRFGPPFIQLAPARELARVHAPPAIEALARAMGAELRAAGIDLDFAPVLDVVTNPANDVIGDRAFGRTAARVIAGGLAFMRGLRSAGIIPCAKHFPGHGNVQEDSHRELPVSHCSRRSLFEVHLKPFVAAIAAGVPMIMMAHLMTPLIDQQRPASLSRPHIEGLLRKRLGFGGVIATDDLQMGALEATGALADRCVAALEAGADLLLACRPVEELAEVFVALAQRAKSPAMGPRLAASVERLERLRQIG
jgi:beta-N-acetylhexosaminidase